MSNEDRNELESVTTLSHITDEDTGEVVEITTDLRDEALQVHGQIEGAFWQLATALSRIKNEKLYLALGYGSFKGYCQETLPFGVRNAYHYAIVGERIGARLVEAGESAKLTSQTLEGFGIEKLRLLAAKAEDQIEALIKEGKVNINDIQLTQDEISDMTVQKFKSALEKAESKAAKYEVEAERRKNAELERDHLKQENEEIKSLEKKLRDRSEREDQIESDLEEAEKAFNLFATRINRIDETAVPERLEFRLVALLDRLPITDENFREKFIDLMYKHNDVV